MTRAKLLTCAAILLALTLAGSGDVWAKKPVKPPPDPEPDPDPAIAFVMTDYPSDVQKVMVVNEDGSNLTVAFDGGGAAIGRRVDWSPDGTKLVFWSDYDGKGIYVYDLVLKELTKVCPTMSSAASLFRPAWSPRAVPGIGECIAFEDHETDGAWDIFLVAPIANSTPVQLTDTEDVWELNPTWSPSGEKLVFHWAGDKYVVYDFDPPENQPSYGVRQHKEELQGVGAVQPAFSKTQEDKVAWMSSLDIWVVDIDATVNANTRLTNTTGMDNLFPSWSPDDSKIVYQCADTARKRPKNHRLEIIDATDGSWVATIPDTGWCVPTWRRNP